MLLCSLQNFNFINIIVYEIKLNILWWCFCASLNFLLHFSNSTLYTSPTSSHISWIIFRQSAQIFLLIDSFDLSSLTTDVYHFITYQTNKNWVELTDTSSCEIFNIPWISVACLLNLKPNCTLIFFLYFTSILRMTSSHKCVLN